MLNLSTTPVTDTNVTNRNVSTHYDLALTDGTLHRVRLSTTYSRDSRQILSFAERVTVTSPTPGILVTNHDPDLYATVAIYPCKRYSLGALTEAHEDARDRLDYNRELGNERITKLFLLRD